MIEALPASITEEGDKLVIETCRLESRLFRTFVAALVRCPSNSGRTLPKPRFHSG